MATALMDPEHRQKPDIGTILHNGDSPLQGDSYTQQKPASLRSEESFKSTFSNLPTIQGPTRIPLTGPWPDAKAKPPAALTSQQETLYAQTLAALSTWTTIPATTARNAPQEPLTDNERMWLTRECILRYLRATKWKGPDALKRMQSTLTWRREYGADTFSADYISPENVTGKQVIQGYDFETRPCLYLNPGRQNTKMSDRQIHHLSYMLDRALHLLPPGQETICLLINFKGAANGAIPTYGQAKAVLNILQNHNPERLGRALISELPWYVTTFFKLISPLIDPVTREKMKFNQDLAHHVPRQQLLCSSGGELDFEYEHDTYWPALSAECDSRREAYRQRWIAGGKRVGELEEYLRGGRRTGIAQTTLDAAETDGVGLDISRLKV